MTIFDNKITFFKRVSAILILITIVLPVSKCERNIYQISDRDITNEEIDILTDDEIDKLPTRKEIEVYYPLSDVVFKDPVSWLPLFIYSWPIILMIILLKIRNKKIKKIITMFELIFSLYTIYYLYSEIILKDPLIGWYISFIAMITYLICHIIFLVKLKPWSNLFRSKR